MGSSGKWMGPLRCLGHRTLVTDEEGPCAAWMSQLAELRGLLWVEKLFTLEVLC